MELAAGFVRPVDPSPGGYLPPGCRPLGLSPSRLVSLRHPADPFGDPLQVRNRGQRAGRELGLPGQALPGQVAAAIAAGDPALGPVLHPGAPSRRRGHAQPSARPAPGLRPCRSLDQPVPAAARRRRRRHRDLVRGRLLGLLGLLGLSPDAPLSCVVVETLHGEQPVADPVSSGLGYERFLRTSPLTAIPVQC